MSKRFIALIFVTMICLFTIGCSNSEENSSSQENKVIITDYEIFETTDSEEYVSFLELIDSSSNRKIVGVSNSVYAFAYTGPFTIYTVTYKICDDKVADKKYEYALFESNSEEKYIEFLHNLEEEYEIFNVSVGSYAYQYTGPNHSYIVTYRKAI